MNSSKSSVDGGRKAREASKSPFCGLLLLLLLLLEEEEEEEEGDTGEMTMGDLTHWGTFAPPTPLPLPLPLPPPPLPLPLPLPLPHKKLKVVPRA